MSPFTYTGVDTRFLGTLATLIESGESTVLLGPRHCGKRYVLQKVASALAETLTVVRVWSLGSGKINTSADLAGVVRDAVRQTGATPPESTSDDPLWSIDWLVTQSARPVVLVAANIDGMAHHLSRLFLRDVRASVSRRRLTVLLSGEYDFRDLVHGPGSEFNTARQFVVQRVDLDVFQDFFDRYTAALNVLPKGEPDAVQRLWEHTGGSIYLMRLLLAQVVEGRARRDHRATQPLGKENLPLPPMEGGTSLADSDYILRHATRMIAREPESWPFLQALLEETPLPSLARFPGPTALELSGIAIRNVEAATLEWASPLMKKLAGEYFDYRRLGDIHASAQDWDNAFACYSRLPPERRARPIDAADRPEVDTVAFALGASLFTEAVKGQTAVRKRFTLACQLLLGFPIVTFWHRSRNWFLLKGDLLPRDRDAIQGHLPRGDTLKPGICTLGHRDTFALAAVLPAVRPGEYSAVAFGDFAKATPFSRERGRIARRLLETFVAASKHATATEADRGRLHVRNHHIQIVNSIFECLGESGLDVKRVLEMAAEGLQILGYYRVEFCMVDPRRERIVGVVDRSDNGVNVAAMTDWPLADPNADIQSFVIFTREAKVVAAPAAEPLINQDVNRKANLRPLAVIPLLTRAGLAIGTVHVERRDNEVPTSEEVDDLLLFGRQLAIAIEQSEQFRLLLAAVDHSPNPVILIGVDGNTLYANEPATRLFPVSAGWSHPASVPASSYLPEDCLAELKKTLQKEHPSALHKRGIGSDSTYRGTVTFDRIVNWNDRTVASVMHIHDQNDLEHVFEALGRVAKARDFKSAIALFAEAFLLLGPTWVRLYLRDETSPNLLVSTLWVGIGDPQRQQRFNDGELVLNSEKEAPDSWQAVTKRVPMIFVYRPNGNEGDTEYTSHELPATVVRNTTQTNLFEKREGEYWIDFPLFTGQANIGKLTLQFDPNLRAETFELLKLLAQYASVLLGAFQERDNMIRDREQYVRIDAAESAIATIAHNVATRIGFLPWQVREYRRIESEYPKLKASNDEFESDVAKVQELLRRTKERLGAVAIQKSLTDVSAVLSRLLNAALPSADWIVTPSAFTATMDRHKLEMAFAEMLANSLSFCGRHPVISVAIQEFLRGASPWMRLTYHDNGPGIPPEHKRRIFEDFFSRRPKNAQKGMGLGLAYVARVIRAHGGTIVENGDPSQGARFVIEIPRHANADNKGPNHD